MKHVELVCLGAFRMSKVILQVIASKGSLTSSHSYPCYKFTEPSFALQSSYPNAYSLDAYQLQG